MPVVALSREELYQRVWSSPGRLLAKDFGISDVALAKICRKYKVPRPGLGYWARVAAGQEVPRTPLRPEPSLTKKICFDVTANMARRAAWAIPRVTNETRYMQTEIQLPVEGSKLVPIAEKILDLMAQATRMSQGA